MNALGNAEFVVTKRTTWECAKCAAKNSSVNKECSVCGHEPTAGRSDIEAQKWDESHKEPE